MIAIVRLTLKTDFLSRVSRFIELSAIEFENGIQDTLYLLHANILGLVSHTYNRN